MKFANVIVDISHEKLDRPFGYIIPDELEEEITVGTAVTIPFGKGNRQIKGYVIEITDQPSFDISKMKEIMAVEEGAAKVESQLINLAYWIKENYGSTMNQALKTVIPVKNKIRNSQIKASVRINYEMLDLYWNLGVAICEKQNQAKWGDAFLKVMSNDLQKAFPGVSGFSVENLKHIRYWYNFYTNNEKWLQGVTQIESMVKSIPWGHNQRIMYKCKDIDEALFYIQKTMDNNWSRNVLVHQIESDLYARQGKAINNFQVKLPEPQSDLAEQTLKDPYNFDFLALREEYNERELEDALVEQITQFLLELGTGFSFIGKQVEIKVGESNFYIDLLFYHVKLHCYVVVELKTEKFKPEFAGQLNFYVTAVNKNMKDEQDNQTIGILICKDKDDVVAEYSLENISQPIGIAQYELTKVLRKEFKSSLPTIEEIEEGLSE